MNGNKLLLDTNTVLYVLGGDETLAQFLHGKELHLSIISELDWMLFCMKSKSILPENTAPLLRGVFFA